MAPVDNKTFTELVGGLVFRSPDVPITANTSLLDLWALAIYAKSSTFTIEDAYMRAETAIQDRNRLMKDLKDEGTLLPLLTPENPTEENKASHV